MKSVNLILVALMLTVVGVGVFVGVYDADVSSPTNSVKHESRHNVFHRDSIVTEFYSHTYHYGDTMTVQIDTIIRK